MIRFIIAILWAIIFLTLSIPILFVEWIIGFFAPHARATSSQWIVNKAFSLVLFISGAKFTVIGRENVPKDRPVLYTPNHRSIFDILVTYVRCERRTGYVAKREIRKVPLLNLWMYFMNCQFLDRSDLRAGLKMINRCVELINDGSSICIFPEGTRNKNCDQDVMEFHEGSFKIAEKTKCTIIPVTINNTESLFENQFPRIRPAHVIIEYGEPIETKDLSREEFKKLGARVHSIVEETYRKNLTLI